MSYKDWPEGERPITRLKQLGASALADSELLSFFLPPQSRPNPLTAARNMLTRHQTLNGVLASDEAPAQLKAGVELVRRLLREALAVRDPLNSPREVRDYLRLTLGNMEHELFVMLMLDAQHRVLVTTELFRGTLTQTSVYPREVVKETLKHNAAAVIFAHNHPSGVAEPSHADELLTRSLKSALTLVDVKVLDHFIVAGTAIISFAERGLI